MFRIFFALLLRRYLLPTDLYAIATFVPSHTHIPMTSYTYPSHTKLKSKKLISEVFEKGQVAKAYPLRAHFLIHSHEELPALQVGVSVSKRYFKKAVDRNRVKRLMREAYRLLQHRLVLQEGQKVAIMFIYNSPEIATQKHISKKVLKILTHLPL